MTRNEFINYLSASKILNVIVSVTRDCVLSCKYCYARKDRYHHKPTIISEALLEKIIRDAFNTRHDDLTFEWTGGEALLAGRDFYEKVLELQSKHKNGKSFHNSLQTSGAIFSPDLYDFLIDNSFDISITLDGPQKYHGAQRPYCDGRDSFENVLKSFDYIKKKQGDCGVLCTITSDMKDAPVEIFNFFRDRGISSWLSNPYIFDEHKPVGEEQLGLRSAEYAGFFAKQFDHWIKIDDTSIHPGLILNLAEALAQIHKHTTCTHGGRCLTNFINMIKALQLIIKDQILVAVFTEVIQKGTIYCDLSKPL